MQHHALSPSELIDPIYQRVSEILTTARNNAWRAINSAMLTAYWEVGKTIVEHEQQGSERAEYAFMFLFYHIA